MNYILYSKNEEIMLNYKENIIFEDENSFLAFIFELMNQSKIEDFIYFIDKMDLNIFNRGNIHIINNMLSKKYY